MPEVFMPRLSDTMQEGTVSSWLKQPGDQVEKGDIIAEIETDKATMELEAYDAGVLERIVVDAGGTVAIGETIAVIGDGSGTAEKPPAEEAAPADEVTDAADDSEPAEAPAEQKPAEQKPAEQKPAEQKPAEQKPAEQAPAPTSAPAPVPEPQTSGGTVKASPLARAMARDREVDLSSLTGTGPGGRIVRADIDAAASSAAASGRAPSSAVADQGPDVTEIKLSKVRKITGQRLLESMQTAPHFYLTSVVDAEALLALRGDVNASLRALADGGSGGDSGTDSTNGRGGGTVDKVSVNDLVVKACAVSLRAHPAVNVSFRDGKLFQNHRVHIGVAVALDDGLIVPVVRDADRKSLRDVSRETRDLAGRARSGKLKPDEFTGSTFSVSNLGMFNVDHFTAVINPPEAAILAVGAARQEAVVRDGVVVPRATMKITLSIDHRALDGATAARFLADLTDLLEHPAGMLV